MINWSDMNVVLYSLSKAKGYVASIIATLGITLGTLVAMFNLNYQVLFADLPYPEYEQIFVTDGKEYYNNQIASEGHVSVASIVAVYNQFKEEKKSVAMVAYGNDVIRSLSNTPNVQLAYSSPEYFEILGTSMALGRSIGIDEGLNAYRPVAVISYKLWQSLYSHSGDVLDKSLRIGETDFKIIGVTSEDFLEPSLVAPGRETDIWLPWDYNPSYVQYSRNWGAFVPWHHLIIKSNPSNIKEVEGKVSTWLNAEFLDQVKSKRGFVGYTIGLELKALRSAITGNSGGNTLWMFIGALLLVLIACSNILNLIIARAASQQRNMAIKASLGAQKKHVFVGIFNELLVLSIGAGIVAMVTTYYAIESLRLIATEYLPMVSNLQLDAVSLLFTVAFLLLFSLVMSVLVHRQIDYQALSPMLQSSGKGNGVQVSSKTRYWLVLSQITLTTLLLVVCMQVLFYTSSLLTQDPGFNVDDRLHVRLNEIRHKITSREEYLKLREARMTEMLAIRQGLLQHPKLESVSVGLTVPINYDGGSYQTSSLAKTKMFDDSVNFETNPSDENHLGIFGNEFISGRNFTIQDIRERRSVMIVNQTAAYRLEPDGNVLNRRYFWDNGSSDTGYEIIAVVGDYSVPGFNEPPRLWTPQGFERDASLAIALKPKQTITAEELNDVISKVTSRYRVEEVNSLSDNLHRYLFKQRLAAGVSAVLSLTAILLASIGVYGVIAYDVRMRRAELGIRMAIGAQVSTLFKQFLKENSRAVISGVFVGLLILMGMWLWLVQSSYLFATVTLGWILPLILIATLTTGVTILSVWQAVKGPITHALRES